MLGEMGRRDGWGAVMGESRSSTMRKTGCREGLGAGWGWGGTRECQAGRVSRFKEGFSHYDSATVYCILQRPYYNGLLAFMLPFTSPAQHLHGKQGQDLRRGGLRITTLGKMTWGGGYFSERGAIGHEF